MLLTPWFGSSEEEIASSCVETDYIPRQMATPQRLSLQQESLTKRPRSLHRSYTDSLSLHTHIRNNSQTQMDQAVSHLLQGDHETRLRVANMLISSSLATTEPEVTRTSPGSPSQESYRQFEFRAPASQWSEQQAIAPASFSQHDISGLREAETYFAPSYHTETTMSSPSMPPFAMYTPETMCTEWSTTDGDLYSTALPVHSSTADTLSYDSLFNPTYPQDVARSSSYTDLVSPSIDAYQGSVSEPDLTEAEDYFTLPTFEGDNSAESSVLQTMGRRKWTQWEDHTLRHAVARYTNHFQKWKRIADEIPGRSAKLCAKRWHYLEKSSTKGYKKGKWAQDEDVAVIEAVNRWTARTSDNIDWNKIAANLPLPRSGSQVQARYTEKLDPTIKKGWWTAQEIEELERAVIKHKGCWYKAAQELPGRTQRQCRMRYLRHVATASDLDGMKFDDEN